MACVHTMKATGRDDVTYCCDCGKTFTRGRREWPKDEEGHDVDPADMTAEERTIWETATG